jgi:hypothetical protein
MNPRRGSAGRARVAVEIFKAMSGKGKRECLERMVRALLEMEQNLQFNNAKEQLVFDSVVNLTRAVQTQRLFIKRCSNSEPF